MMQRVLCRLFQDKWRLNVSSVTMTTGCFLLNAAVGTGQRLGGVMGDGCWVGGSGGDLGKYMNGAMCLRPCGAHLAVVHGNNKNKALCGLHGVSVNVSE